MIVPTEMKCRALTAQELETVAGGGLGGETITAKFKVGNVTIEVWADKNRYGVCTSVSGKSGQSCVLVQ